MLIPNLDSIVSMIILLVLHCQQITDGGTSRRDFILLKNSSAAYRLWSKAFTLLLAGHAVDICRTITAVLSRASYLFFALECLPKTAPSSITCLPSCIPAFGSQGKLLNKPKELLTSAAHGGQYSRHLLGVKLPGQRPFGSGYSQLVELDSWYLLRGFFFVTEPFFTTETQP